MVDPKRATELIRQHFAELTTEQFVENLKKSCPEVFEDEEEEKGKDDRKSEARSLHIDRQI